MTAFRLDYSLGAAFLTWSEGRAHVIVHHEGVPYVGVSECACDEPFAMRLGIIGGLPPTASLQRDSSGVFSLGGALGSHTVRHTQLSEEIPFCGTFQGGARSEVNGGSVALQFAVDASGALSGVIHTPPGPLLMQGRVSLFGHATIDVQGAEGAIGQTGGLFGNLLPCVPGVEAKGVYTGGAGDYGHWWAELEPFSRG